MAVTMIIGLIVAIVELIITIRKKATKKTKKANKTMLFKDFMKAVENTRNRKKAETETVEAEAV